MVTVVDLVVIDADFLVVHQGNLPTREEGTVSTSV